MAPTVLSCSVCGSPVRILGKTGAMIISDCPNCGMNSQAMVANYLNSIDKQIEERNTKKVEIVRVDRRRNRVINDSPSTEPPAI
jgi:uncharacterized Zn finger protein (UPF0148 family)